MMILIDLTYPIMLNHGQGFLTNISNMGEEGKEVLFGFCLSVKLPVTCERGVGTENGERWHCGLKKEGGRVTELAFADLSVAVFDDEILIHWGRTGTESAETDPTKISRLCAVRLTEFSALNCNRNDMGPSMSKSARYIALNLRNAFLFYCA